ncbi:MAG TPA: DUF1549 domain-containing protein, partial [Terracidiphilus sp.]
MELRRLLLLAVLTGGCAVPVAIVAVARGQAPPKTSDTPYHQSDMSKPQGSPSQSSKEKQPAVSTPHKPSLLGLGKISILPSSVSITGPHYGQRVVVEGIFADGHQEDLTSQAVVAISNPEVAKLDADQVARPTGDGETTITATVQGRRASAPLTVKDYATANTWSFRNDVLPVMTKVGCNSGPCHGAAAGKNGFKLSLRGYDPVTDYFTLTHQALARRTDRLEPAKSLILLKPTLAISHGGGRRFDVGSPEYKILSGWLAQGMPAPEDSDAVVKEIQVLPREASLVRGAEQQLIVTAVFSDGRTADVTRWAKYDSGDEGVASVDNLGHVTMHGYGEAPVTVWYQSHVTFSRLRIPFPYKVEDAVFRKAPRNNYIDDAILDHLRALHIPPSPQAGDAEFIRRAYLDAAGILPSTSDVDRFLKDPSPEKRNRLI